MGFEGTEVTPQIRKLISEHYIGSILLKASNLKCKLNLTPYLAHDFVYVVVQWLATMIVSTSMAVSVSTKAAVEYR